MSNSAATVSTDNERPVAADVREYFRRFAHGAAELAGSVLLFFSAVGIIALWAVVGPYFHYSDTWQLIINTATTIITFLMVFLIQNTQNRDAQEIHLKLDELIRSNVHQSGRPFQRRSAAARPTSCEKSARLNKRGYTKDTSPVHHTNLSPKDPDNAVLSPATGSTKAYRTVDLHLFANHISKPRLSRTTGAV